ncbi:hypothetical protein CKG00_09070 [Morganella morganii]|uniref:Chromosome partitioning protein ParB n=1 Tax=Morganella morganii TaxID=582 RepID=A0A433ZWL1_MORMO|nr:ParB family protein [Morganella morganii]RUT66524.1 hypothetical protein CKG00_09070 [Morganella morganii]
MNNSQGTLVPVSLDQLRAFDLNPRITRNPNYYEIKGSIRNRGLDHPPQITQRPGEAYYIIANGGNTRLAILNDLWLETHDKRYWHITCLLRPWSSDSLEQGNLHCLLGHLIENEVRGSLTFIERSLAVQNAIDLCQNINKECSQHETVRMLSQAGYFVSQTLLSVMLATTQLLFPYIPDLLYSGLSRKNIERLLTLRFNTEKFWDNFCQALPPEEWRQLPLFDDIFAMALTSFNEPAMGFSLEHVQDELTGLISQTLNIDYNTVALVTDGRAQKRNLLFGTAPVPELPEISEQRSVELKHKQSGRDHLQEKHDEETGGESENANLSMTENRPDEASNNSVLAAEHRHSADASPVLPATQPSLAAALPLREDPQFDTPETLASFIDQIAWELASNAGLEFLISPTDTGVFDIASP